MPLDSYDYRLQRARTEVLLVIECSYVWPAEKQYVRDHIRSWGVVTLKAMTASLQGKIRHRERHGITEPFHAAEVFELSTKQAKTA